MFKYFLVFNWNRYKAQQIRVIEVVEKAEAWCRCLHVRVFGVCGHFERVPVHQKGSCSDSLECQCTQKVPTPILSKKGWIHMFRNVNLQWNQLNTNKTCFRSFGNVDISNNFLGIYCSAFFLSKCQNLYYFSQTFLIID